MFSNKYCIRFQSTYIIQFQKVEDRYFRSVKKYKACLPWRCFLFEEAKRAKFPHEVALNFFSALPSLCLHV
jgi:hypothetical protein